MGLWTSEELFEAIEKSSLSEVLDGVLFDVRGKMSPALGAAQILSEDLNKSEQVDVDDLKLVADVLFKSLIEAQEILTALTEANRRTWGNQNKNMVNDSGN